MTKKKLPLISIAILNRNGLFRLKQVIPSILKQSYKNLEIICFDNGSSDESVSFLKKNKIKVIESKVNVGYGKAKNKLVTISNGEYILLLDNDIELTDQQSIEKFYKAYQQKEAGFFSPLVVNKNSKVVCSIGLFYTSRQRCVSLEKAKNNGTILVGGFHGNSVFFKKELFLYLGGYDEIYPFNIDDYDLSARASNAGYNCYIVTDIVVSHHGIDTRTELKPIVWKTKYMFAGFSRMIWKNYPWQAISIWWPISSMWLLNKTLKQVFIHKSFLPIYSFIKSVLLFLSDFDSTLKARKKDKNKKVARFLKIKPNF